MISYLMPVLRSVAIPVLTVILCGCASTSLKNTWKSPAALEPVRKVAVVAVTDRGLLRQGFENRLVEQIKSGTPALVTFNLLALNEIAQDKRAAADRFSAAGADSVLIVRLLSANAYYRETQPGGSRYVGSVNDITAWGWYDFYSLSAMDLSPTYGSLTEKLYVETAVYDLATERRLWSCITKTVLKEHADRVGEMDPLVEKVVAAMRQDGIVR